MFIMEMVCYLEIFSHFIYVSLKRVLSFVAHALLRLQPTLHTSARLQLTLHTSARLHTHCNYALDIVLKVQSALKYLYISFSREITVIVEIY